MSGEVEKCPILHVRPKFDVFTLLFKLYPGGSAEHTYPQFQNSQEFALDGGVIFDILANSNEFHSDEVYISAL